MKTVLVSALDYKSRVKPCLWSCFCFEPWKCLIDIVEYYMVFQCWSVYVAWWTLTLTVMTKELLGTLIITYVPTSVMLSLYFYFRTLIITMPFYSSSSFYNFIILFIVNAYLQQLLNTNFFVLSSSYLFLLNVDWHNQLCLLLR